jgi:hypothetical protein
VNAGTGAVVGAGASAVVAEVAGVVVVATRVVDVDDVDVVVMVVDDLDRGPTVLSAPDDPHAAAVSMMIAANAHATR